MWYLKSKSVPFGALNIDIVSSFKYFYDNNDDDNDDDDIDDDDTSKCVIIVAMISRVRVVLLSSIDANSCVVGGTDASSNYDGSS